MSRIFGKRSSMFMHRLPAIGFPVIFIGILSGCAAFSAIPVTLKEMKDYVVGQEESFSYPLNQVLAATVHGLRQTGFAVEKIEYFNDRGLINANWEETGVILALEAVTPKLTKVKSKIRRGDASREYSSENELFNNVRNILNSQEPLNWRNLTAGMVTVHISPDKKSPVVAYLGSGANADIIEKHGDWGKIALMEGGTGFILLKHLRPVTTQNVQQ